MASADVKRGSWWPDYREWLGERAGQLKPAATALGSRKHRASARAPGSYVPPAEGSVTAASGDRAGFEHADRFVFGAEPVRKRWMGRPLAETRGWLELARLLADPSCTASACRAQRSSRRAHAGFPRRRSDACCHRGMAAADWLRPRLCGVLARCRLSDRTLDRLERRVEVVWRYYGRRVGLIGHKPWRPLRAALAAHRPDRVSHAISMGADLRGLLGASAPTLFAVRRRAARSPRHCTSGQRNMPHRSSVQPRLRRAVPVRAGPPHEHLVTGRRRGPLTMSGDSARRLRRGDRQPHRPRL